jgi:hypothetical protein
MRSLSVRSCLALGVIRVLSLGMIGMISAGVVSAGVVTTGVIGSGVGAFAAAETKCQEACSR